MKKQFQIITPRVRIAYLVSFLTAFSAVHSKAAVFQILHTNDLHAALHTFGAPSAGEPEFGNWGRIKTKMDQLTQSAKDQGIETIRLDAGDFFEGTLDYFPDSGKNVLKAFQSLGYDAAALGNHDWLMGARSMDKVFGEQPFPFPILSANAKIAWHLKNLSTQVVPSTQLTRNGIKFGILGLSTHERFYRWYTNIDSGKQDLKILNYEKIAKQMTAYLQYKNDVVIALTHLGYDLDRKLVKNSRGLDLVIGGHSHTILESLVVTENLEGRGIPIVQTGVNGKYIGRILLEAESGKRAQVLSYELIPITTDIPIDPNFQKLETTSNQRILDLYTPQALQEVIGKSEVRLTSGELGPSAYGQFVTDAMRVKIVSEVAIDSGSLRGNTDQPAGSVTRRMLMEMVPRKFEVSQNEGPYIYQSEIPGWVIEAAIKLSVKWGFYIFTSGVEYSAHQFTAEELEAVKMKYPMGERVLLSGYYADEIKINGESLCRRCNYTTALPESIARGAFGMSQALRVIFKKTTRTPSTIWNASVDYVKKIGTIRKLKPKEIFVIPEILTPDATDDGGYFVPWVNPDADFEPALREFLKYAFTMR